MNPLTEARKLLRYLLGKKSEFEDLDLKDIVMAKAILDIHRTRSAKEILGVPLFDLRQIHLLERKNAIAATRQRVETLQAHKQELLGFRTLTCDTLARVLPSVSWIKAVRKSEHEFLAFEGNGRIAAMQTVFEPDDEMFVEIEEYRFRNPTRIIRRLDRVRRMNGLLAEEQSHG
jgi:hypothetical protein